MLLRVVKSYRVRAKAASTVKATTSGSTRTTPGRGGSPVGQSGRPVMGRRPGPLGFGWSPRPTTCALSWPATWGNVKPLPCLTDTATAVHISAVNNPPIEATFKQLAKY